MNLIIINDDSATNTLTLSRPLGAASLENGGFTITLAHVDMTGDDAISDLSHWIEGMK